MNRLIIKRFASAVASHGQGHGYAPAVASGGQVLRKATWDDFPIPAGSWREHYNQKQKKNNAVLAVGVLSFALTVAYVIAVDPFNFEKVFGPYKYMKNPPAFESPVLEPNVLQEYLNSVQKK